MTDDKRSDSDQSATDGNVSSHNPADKTDSGRPDNAGADLKSGQAEQAASPTSGSTKPKDAWTDAPEVAATAKSSREARPAMNANDWQQDLVNRLAFASLNEQRRASRWGILFKSFTTLYVGIILWLIIKSMMNLNAPILGKHTALVDVEGVIAANAEASADHIVTGLRAAFEEKNSVAVIIRINSPGGSPVQAGYVYDEVKRLRKKYPDKKVYAVITDMCASGGYYIAASADEVYADKASLVGSIGVLMNGFGFVETMKKLGVERRLLTAGEHKGILDPFSPIKKDELEHVQGMLDGIHKQFINIVKEGRGDRLSDSPKLFSGLFWNGEEGVELGLVDGLGSTGYVARDIIGAEKIVNYTPRTDYLDRFADRLGASMAKVLGVQLGLSNTQLR